MAVLQFIVNHWSQIGLGVSEVLGLFGMGGVVKQIVNTIFPKKTDAQPASS